MGIKVLPTQAQIRGRKPPKRKTERNVHEAFFASLSKEEQAALLEKIRGKKMLILFQS